MPLSIGQKAQRSLQLTGEHVRLYAEITGDHNPLHFDPAFAAGTKFGRLVVQGGLTTGLLHALVATELPGPGTVFLGQNWKFTAPVFIGDTITAEAEVLSVHASKPVTQLGIRVWRQDGRDSPRRRSMVLSVSTAAFGWRLTRSSRVGWSRS